jgi:hypothetical protein
MRVYLTFRTRRCVDGMLLIRDVRLITGLSQNSLTGALEEFQSYRPLFTEIFQREQVDPIFWASVSTAYPVPIRKCRRRSCPLYRRPSNEQSYLSSKQPQLSSMLPACNSEQQTTV